jgi:hypothetical protein
MTSQSPDESQKMPTPFSLRLTFEERARLERDAAGMSLGAYVRWRVFDPDKPPPRRRNKTPVKDHQAICQVLARLGQSRISSNLNQLARAANSGSLALTPETQAVLNEANAEIGMIRTMLVSALGMEARES